jgi:hypothetical protein
MDLVARKFPAIAIPLNPIDRPLPVLHTIRELACILRVPRPILCTLAVLSVLAPLAFVDCAIGLVEDTIAVHHILDPLPLVVHGVWDVRHPSSPVRLVVAPLALVHAPILLHLTPDPMSLVQLIPLAYIIRPALHIPPLFLHGLRRGRCLNFHPLRLLIRCLD